MIRNKVIFNFDKQFVEPILSAQKHSTIRSEVKCLPGDIMSHCCDDKEFLRAICQSVSLIEILPFGLTIAGRIEIFSKEDKDQFAYKEGSETWDNFIEFVDQKYGLPFLGVIHMWSHIDRRETPCS